ncbi:hypothetical protein SDC9_72887 [bioreactor metagenome]|uniref:Uncharacterized protein n=1 Tax=bioreactor metagenome TaxID=1076179 RepID=A0A644YCV6_9ZZZZ
MLFGSNIIPIAKVPSKAVTATITASAIIPFGKSFDGFFILLTYGDIFSHPPTANTNIAKLVKYSKLKSGIKFFILKSML